MFRAPIVFLDTNIFKFSANKKYVYRKRQQSINWGNIVREVDIHRPYTINQFDRIRSAVQLKDASYLSAIALLGIEGWIKCVSHHEVDWETAGLPSMSSPLGRFYDCPIEWVSDPHPPVPRVVLGGAKSANDYALEFFSNFRDPRYLELVRVTGAYQGKSKPIHLNQARDAYFLWCAEAAGVDFFLTMDYKLVGLAKNLISKSDLKVITPTVLLRDVLLRIGIVRTVPLLFRCRRFQNRIGVFAQGDGWI